MKQELNNFFDELLQIHGGINHTKILQCRRILSKKLKQKVILHLHEIVLLILDNTEPHYYYELRKTVDIFNIFITKYLSSRMIKHENLISEKNYDALVYTHILLGAMTVNCRFSSILEKIGLPGESFKYLMKSYDPFIENYNRETHEGEAHLNQTRFFEFDSYWHINIALGYPNAREIYIQREILQLKLRTVLGDINHEGLNDYSFINELIIVGHNATRSDIIFLCVLGEFLYKFYKNDDRLNEIIDKLCIQLDFEIKNVTKNIFDIANTLLSITNDWSFSQVAFAFVDQTGLLDSQKLKAAHLILKIRILSSKYQFSETNLTEAYENLLKVINDNFTDSILNKLIRQSYSQVIIDLVLFCLEIEREDLALEYAYQWKVNNPLDKEMNSAILFTISNMLGNKVVHILRNNNKYKVLKIDNTMKLSDINAVQSKIEGIWLASFENPDSFVYNVENLGDINVTLSDSYEEMIVSYFGLELLKEEILQLDNTQEIRTFELSWSNIPFIPILTSKTNHSFSSLVTNQQYNTKPISKVLIWCDPKEDLNFAIREKEMLIQLLQSYGVSYNIFEGSECTKDLFIESYSSSEYDLIWIMCHGSFNPDDPTDSELIIEKNNPITARELSNINLTDSSQRILVLNACQSSSSAVRYNSMGFLGLAPLLTSNYQIVVGHLWTVDFTASTILGSLLANGLLQGISPGKALSDSIRVMKCGNDTVIQEMKKLNNEFDLIKDYTTKNMKDVFFSGSPMMFM